MIEAIRLYTQIVEIAIPIAITFEIGNLIVSTFMRMAFGGRVEIK